MHFNVYIDDETGQRLSSVAQQSGESRNALIRKAIREWLMRRHKPQWPDEVLEFEGVSDAPTFEAGRQQLRSPHADPFV